MDSIQFHPTATAYPELLLGALVTEVARSRGAHLVNADGERYINELETRDVVASANIKQVVREKKGIETPLGMHGMQHLQKNVPPGNQCDGLYVGSPSRRH